MHRLGSGAWDQAQAFARGTAYGVVDVGASLTKTVGHVAHRDVSGALRFEGRLQRSIVAKKDGGTVDTHGLGFRAGRGFGDVAGTALLAGGVAAAVAATPVLAPVEAGAAGLAVTLGASEAVAAGIGAAGAGMAAEAVGTSAATVMRGGSWGDAAKAAALGGVAGAGSIGAKVAFKPLLGAVAKAAPRLAGAAHLGASAAGGAATAGGVTLLGGGNAGDALQAAAFGGLMAGATHRGSPAPAAGEAPRDLIHSHIKDYKKVGGPLGTSGGGQYVDGAGRKFYVKESRTNDHARNEVLAGKLYQATGAPVVASDLIDLGGGKLGTVSAWQEHEGGFKPGNAGQKQEARGHFATHAWLGNWDAVGLAGDNQVPMGGKLTTVDVGGALNYRAQGAPKAPADFGTEVLETRTMRDPKLPAGKVFGGMSDAELQASVLRVAGVDDDAIRALAMRHGPGSEADRTALAQKLVARKQDLARQAGVVIPKAKGVKPFALPDDLRDWHGKDEPAKVEALDAYAAQQLKQLTRQQREAVRRYKATLNDPSIHYRMNSALRNPDPANVELNELNARVTEALDRSVLPVDVDLSRGIAGVKPEQFVGGPLEPGRTFVHGGFASASWADVKGYDLTLKFQGKAGDSAMVMTVQEFEHEVLYPHDSAFRIDRVERLENGHTVLHCTLLRGDEAPGAGATAAAAKEGAPAGPAKEGKPVAPADAVVFVDPLPHWDKPEDGGK